LIEILVTGPVQQRYRSCEFLAHCHLHRLELSCAAQTAS